MTFRARCAENVATCGDDGSVLEVGAAANDVAPENEAIHRLYLSILIGL